MPSTRDPDAFLKMYPTLHAHLVEMRSLDSRGDCAKRVEHLNLAETSRIVTETRDAIIRWVTEALPDPKTNALFILGGTGSGKSTTLCFFLGYTMKLRDDYTFESLQEPELIGHCRTKSCTFLPNVYEKDGRTVVDFPGFDDTNGHWINQGIECALKRLLAFYNAVLLVLEAITNVHGRFAQPALLRERLTRLFANKGKCILGLTKYTLDDAYGDIQKMERKIRKLTASLKNAEAKQDKRLQKILKLEKRLLDVAEETAESIEQIKKDLEKRQCLYDQTHAKLLEEKRAKTEGKIGNYRARIQQRQVYLTATEDTFLKTIDLTELMRLSDLANPALLDSCWNVICSMEPIKVCDTHHIDPKAEAALLEIFERTALPEINKTATSSSTLSEADFLDSVRTSSLTATLFAASHPTVGEYLHLAEMDPKIAKKFDGMILESALEMTQIAFMRRFPEQDYTHDLKVFILDQHGKQTTTPQQVEDGWLALRETYKDRKGPFNVPAWCVVRLICGNLASNRIEDGGLTLEQVRLVMSILLSLENVIRNTGISPSLYPLPALAQTLLGVGKRMGHP